MTRHQIDTETVFRKTQFRAASKKIEITEIDDLNELKKTRPKKVHWPLWKLPRRLSGPKPFYWNRWSLDPRGWFQIPVFRCQPEFSETRKIA